MFAVTDPTKEDMELVDIIKDVLIWRMHVMIDGIKAMELVLCPIHDDEKGTVLHLASNTVFNSTRQPN